MFLPSFLLRLWLVLYCNVLRYTVPRFTEEYKHSVTSLIHINNYSRMGDSHASVLTPQPLALATQTW